jgi:hypothetical protein
MDAGIKDCHALVVGRTQYGKSRMVGWQIVHSFDEDNPKPLCYLDPKGSTYDLVQALFLSPKGRVIWERYKDRILFVNPMAVGKSVLGFNALSPLGKLDHADPDYVALLANSIVSHIRRQSGFEMNEANRMQNIMSAAIGLLAEGGAGKLTLAELPLLFVPAKPTGKPVDDGINPFTRRLLKNTQHYGTRSFWLHQWSNWSSTARREWVQSTEGRIYSYLFNQKVLYTTCAVESAVLDWDKIVNEGYWVFVKIPAQLMDESMTMMIGNLIISKIFHACMQRSDKPYSYHLILDEARFFNSGPLQEIMDTAGEYQLWLTLVAQNLNQMCEMVDGRQDQRLRESILNNCGWIASFQNVPDAEALAQMMYPITGRIPSGLMANGNIEYLPVVAEENRNQRRFMDLKPREVLLYEKDGSPPTWYYTAQVERPRVAPGALAFFETQHMRATGFPAELIHQEIVKRQEAIYKEIDPTGWRWDTDAPIRHLPGPVLPE